ncbi:MAG: hypothetical protein D6730_17160 [Bacteroidetes bacterium]|nr:MAG: hypothetical protein D6730_17160 [Bacteroidota bacterium]
MLAPSLVLLAYWYRKQLNQTLMVWKKPEMVIVTISFSIISLILFIVGVSCFFTHWGYLDSRQIEHIGGGQFERLGWICMLLLAASVMVYMAVRMLLVQIVTHRGIVVNSRLFRIPDYRHVIEWHEISDYYLVSDYPNVIFTLIVQKEALRFSRITVCVPVFVRDEFESILETKMFSDSAIEARSQISKHRFSEK